MAEVPSCHVLYRGHVMHARQKPFHHQFRYGVFSVLLDLDHLDDVRKASRLFSYNKHNLYSFFDKDHGARDGTPLRPWVEAMLQKAGVSSHIASIKLLCYPRVLGYVFNPLSVYYCYDSDLSLIALIYEVSNTFGEGHCYVGKVEAGDQEGTYALLATKKVFYVSPFIEVVGDYRFRFDNPQDRLRLMIQLFQDEKHLLYTQFTGTRSPLTSANLIRAFFGYPLLTVKVITAIHWQAFKLWVKGATYIPRPHQSQDRVTLAQQVEKRSSHGEKGMP